jgi:hypothetical protein
MNSKNKNVMQSLEMLTINEEPKGKEDLMELLWEAIEYFPEGIWGDIRYLGNIDLGHDVMIKLKTKFYKAFVFESIMRRIAGMKKLLKSEALLLALMRDPVIAIYPKFERGKFRRVVSLVHDYVSKDVGIVSLFKLEEETAVKVAAHGLGHSQGLRHHQEPIDLMYARLLNGNLMRDGFCDGCQRELRMRSKLEE